MALFDSLIGDLTYQFDLGPKAAPLVRALLRHLIDLPGGVAWYVEGLRAAGHGAVVDGWIRRTDSPPLTDGEVTAFLGEPAIAALGQSVGLSGDAATRPLAFALPKVIELVSPNGVLPVGVPPATAAFLGMPAASAAIIAAPLERRRIGWAAPVLLLLAVAGGVWYWTTGRAPAPASQPATVQAPAPPAQAESPAVVPPPAAHPAAPESAAAPPPVQAPAPPPVPEAAVVPPPSMPIPAPGPEVALAPPPAPNPAPKPALAVTPPALLASLNSNSITFQTASASLSAEDRNLLRATAGTLRALPPGTVLEVSGHTDDTGNAAANQRLSQARADAVRSALIADGIPPAALVAKGYGSLQPVASDDTPEGRARNRRIEYRVNQQPK